jgi:hypothetical protein
MIKHIIPGGVVYEHSCFRTALKREPSIAAARREAADKWRSMRRISVPNARLLWTRLKEAKKHYLACVAAGMMDDIP